MHQWYLRNKPILLVKQKVYLLNHFMRDGRVYLIEENRDKKDYQLQYEQKKTDEIGISLFELVKRSGVRSLDGNGF